MQKKGNIGIRNIQKYRNKQLLLVAILLICIISIISILARYVTSNENNFFMRTKEFYFDSDKLAEDTAVYQIDNWSGVDDYTFTINMNSRDNNLNVASYDIGYSIKYKCSDNAICQLSKTEGIIPASTNSDYVYITITPNAQLDTGDEVVVEIEATSTAQYTKTLKGKFKLVVGKENLTYEITDKAHNPYMELSITNTLSYYIVNEAFGEYSIGEKIDIDTYMELSEINQAKCYSSIVTITFDPRDVLIDITNNTYAQATNITTEIIDNNTYVNGLTVSIEAISSVNLRFYKTDQTNDYTYPNGNNSPIVTVTSI